MVLRIKPNQIGFQPTVLIPQWITHPCILYLPCGRYLLALLIGNKPRSEELMFLRVRPSPTQFPINILYSQEDGTLLLSSV